MIVLVEQAAAFITALSHSIPKQWNKILKIQHDHGLINNKIFYLPCCASHCAVKSFGRFYATDMSRNKRKKSNSYSVQMAPIESFNGVPAVLCDDIKLYPWKRHEDRIMMDSDIVVGQAVQFETWQSCRQWKYDFQFIHFDKCLVHDVLNYWKSLCKLFIFWWQFISCFFMQFH